MSNSNQRGTNAGDSAPGVDDGRARNAAPDHSKAGRGRVWLWIAISLVILLGIFLARPLTSSRGGDQMIEHGTTARDVAQSGAAGRRTAMRRPALRVIAYNIVGTGRAYGARYTRSQGFVLR